MHPLRDVQDTVRLPFYSTDGPRLIGSNSSGFIGDSSKADSLLVNCYARRIEDGYEVVKRHGLDKPTSGTSSVCSKTGTLMCAMSMQAINGYDIVAVWDGSKIWIVKMADDTGAGEILIGSFTPGSTPSYVWITEYNLDNVNPGIAVSWNASNLSSTNTGYYATTSGGTFAVSSLTNIVDVDFPGNISGEQTVGPFVQLNQRIFIMGRTGTLYNSDLGSPSSWSADGTIRAQMEPDKALGLAKYKHHLAAMGEGSIEFFEDVGLSPGTPLQRTEQAFIKIGVANPNSYLNIDDTIYWVSAGPTGAAGLYKLEQYSPVKISGTAFDQMYQRARPDPALQWMLNGGVRHLVIQGVYTTWSPNSKSADTFILTDSSGGTDAAAVTGATPTGSIVYNLQDNTWWALNVFNNENVRFWSVNRGMPVSAPDDSQRVYAQSAADGSTIRSRVWNPSVNIFQDWDSASTYRNMIMVIQLPNENFGNLKYKFITKAIVDAFIENSIANPPAGGTSFQMWLVIDKSGGLSKDLPGNINARNIPIPKTGTTGTRRYSVNNLGRSVNWNFAIVLYGNTSFIGRGLELEVTQGTSN